MAENPRVFELVEKVFPHKEVVLGDSDGVTAVFRRAKGNARDIMTPSGGYSNFGTTVVYANKDGTSNHTKIEDLSELLDKSNSLVFDFKGSSKFATVSLTFGGVDL